MNMRMIFGTIAAAVVLAGCVSGPKVDNAPVATQDEIIKCPEIHSEGFSLEMPGLEDSLYKVKLFDRKAFDSVLRSAEGKDGNIVRSDWCVALKSPDAAVVRDAVRSAIEATGRFGKEMVVGKRDGRGLGMYVRIAEQEWHTEKKPPSPYKTRYLQIQVEVTVRLPLNSLTGDSYIGYGSERLYETWGTMSYRPAMLEDYVHIIVSAVKKALRDLHPFPERIKGKK